MKAEDVNPFIQSVNELFESMLGCAVKPGEPCVIRDDSGPPDIIGVIGLSGTVKGVVAVKFPVQTALKVVGRMVGAEFRTVDASIIDGVGELVNIVAGSAKTKIEGHSITLSLPSVVRGSILNNVSSKSSVFFEVPFETELGNFSLAITLKRTPSHEQEVANASVGSR
ncbi:MAG: chemotaxis protein CheX [Candidatus Zixiibacteriota bacterium]